VKPGRGSTVQGVKKRKTIERNWQGNKSGSQASAVKKCTRHHEGRSQEPSPAGTMGRIERIKKSGNSGRPHKWEIRATSEGAKSVNGTDIPADGLKPAVSRLPTAMRRINSKTAEQFKGLWGGNSETPPLKQGWGNHVELLQKKD